MASFTLRKSATESALRSGDAFRGVGAAEIVLTGQVSPTGTVAKLGQKVPMTAGLTPAGALTLGRRYAKVIEGDLDVITGIVGLQKTKLLAGLLSPVGGLDKQGQKTRSASLSPAGTIQRLRAFGTFTAALSPAGVTRRAVTLLRTGTLTPAPGVLKRVPQNYITGGLTPAGLNRGGSPRLFRRVAATLAPAGDLLVQLLGTIYGPRGCAQQSLAPAALAIHVVEERQMATMAQTQTGRARQVLEACA